MTNRGFMTTADRPIPIATEVSAMNRPEPPDFLNLLWDEQLQQLMLVACPDGVILTDAEGRIVLYTGASESLFEWAPVEVLGHPAALMFASSTDYEEFYARLHADGRVTNTEVQGRRKEGETFHAAISASILRDRYGQTMGAVLYIRDHTRLQRIQNDLRSKNEKLNKMVNTLHHVARHDPLTGLLHRGSALEAAEGALLRAGMEGRPLGVAVFDLDDFKKVNDSYGHLVGDEALAALSTVLASVAREEDVVGRFGGEEFVAFLPNAGLTAVQGFAERVREAFERTTVSVRGQFRIRVTISAGVACIPECAENLQEAIRIADERLLISKRLGRNRVTAADEDRTAA